MAFPRFGMVKQITDIGYDCQIVNKGSPTFDNRGDISGVTYTYTNVQGIIQQMSVLDVEVQEGKMQPQDVIAYFDQSVIVSGQLITGNWISGSFFGTSSLTYEIKGVEQLPGHYEVYASKL